MNLSLNEVMACASVLTSMPVEKIDRDIASEVWGLVKTLLQGEDGKQNFVEGELELKTTHKALLMKLLENGSWTIIQFEAVVKPFIEKLN